MKNDQHGFTLLEIILSLLFSSIIVVILVATMHFAVRSEEKGEEWQDTSQHLRIIVSRLTFLLKGAYPYRTTVDDKKVYYFRGEPGSISFITSAVSKRDDSPMDRPGLKWVKIFRDADGLKLKENFFFLSDDYENETVRERLLDDTVTEITFEYLDTGEERDEEPEWKSEWSTEDNDYLPAAVRVSLKIQAEGNGTETGLQPFVVKIETPQKAE